MIELVAPDPRWHTSWAEAVREFDGTTMHGSGLWNMPLDDLSLAALERELARLRIEADTTVEPAPDRVHSDYYWIVDGDEFVGYVALRHALTPFLLEEGGHIGYAVRPARRGQGVATRALALTLPHARRLGLERVLLTCDTDNEASRRTILANGGVLEDVRAGKERYWIDLS